MEKQDFVLWFKELGKEDIPLVGGKCANLGELSAGSACLFQTVLPFRLMHIRFFWKRQRRTKRSSLFFQKWNTPTWIPCRISQRRSGNISKVCPCQRIWRRRSCGNIGNFANVQGKKICGGCRHGHPPLLKICPARVLRVSRILF